MALREAGAIVQLTPATSDAALTRNSQAGLANDILSGNEALDWVLWLDSDMSASVDSVLLLIAIAEALFEDSLSYPSVSGSYVNRHMPIRSELAAFAIDGAKEKIVSIVSDVFDQPLAFRCVPAFTGMGCLLQRSAVFLAHVNESNRFTYPIEGSSVPCVSQAHLCHASELGQWLHMDKNADVSYWLADDYDYCLREFEEGRLIYLAPVAFGHDKTQTLLPDGSTVFPGLRPPTDPLHSDG
jgi:hypothetical protein